MRSLGVFWRGSGAEARVSFGDGKLLKYWRSSGVFCSCELTLSFIFCWFFRSSGCWLFLDLSDAVGQGKGTGTVFFFWIGRCCKNGRIRCIFCFRELTLSSLPWSSSRIFLNLQCRTGFGSGGGQETGYRGGVGTVFFFWVETFCRFGRSPGIFCFGGG